MAAAHTPPYGWKMFPKGLLHPPKNNSVARQPTVIMLAYSAMKNMANFIELYSVW